MSREFRLGLAARKEAPNHGASGAARRLDAIRAILSALREQEIARLTSMVHHEKERDAVEESDQARIQQEMEMHVSLLWRSQNRLQVIWAALERLEQGRFGLCEECGEEISLERLSAIPMASYCIECQSRNENFLAAEVPTTFTSFAFTPLAPSAGEEPAARDEGIEGYAASRRRIKGRGRPAAIAKKA